METLEQISYNVFFKMNNYSQLVIDLVEELEEVEDSETENQCVDTLKSINYKISNVLEIIDENRIADIEVLELLNKITSHKIKSI